MVHPLHQFVGSLRRNQALGFFEGYRQRGSQIRRGPNEMSGTLGARGLSRGLADRFAKSDANAAIVECPDEAESDRGQADLGPAGCEIKRVRHGDY